jgi:nitrogen fixation protein
MSESLSSELDARLVGWLERRAATGPVPRADLEAAAVITVADGAVADVERLCHGWGLRVRSIPRDGGRWSVLRVDGPALPVVGLTEIARAG